MLWNITSGSSKAEVEASSLNEALDKFLLPGPGGLAEIIEAHPDDAKEEDYIYTYTLR